MRRWKLARAAQLVGGLVILGSGVSVLLRARLGLGPWDVLHQGVSNRTSVPIGTVSILVGIPVLACWWPLRQRPGIGTFANMVLLGLTVDATSLVLPTARSIYARLLCLAGGVALTGAGAALYIGADLGPGPRDGLMMGLHRHLGLSVRLGRTLVEATALLIGVVLGGTVGVGTLVYAFLVGPAIKLAFRFVPRWTPVEGDAIVETRQ